MLRTLQPYTCMLVDVTWMFGGHFTPQKKNAIQELTNVLSQNDFYSL